MSSSSHTTSCRRSLVFSFNSNFAIIVCHRVSHCCESRHKPSQVSCLSLEEQRFCLLFPSSKQSSINKVSVLFPLLFSNSSSYCACYINCLTRLAPTIHSLDILASCHLLVMPSTKSISCLAFAADVTVIIVLSFARISTKF